jgi:integrase/recombinase XerD
MATVDLTCLKPEELTWDSAFRMFALRCRSQNLSSRTQQLYAEKLRNFRRWAEPAGRARPVDITANDLRAFIDSWKERGVSDQTVDGFFRVLRTFWRYLHREGLLLLNPMDRVERPIRARRFAQPFTDEQVKQLLAVINKRTALGLRDYALISLFADTGLRLNEGLSIRVSDIDWAGQSIIVVGKGRRERRVAFGQAAKQALLAWMRIRGTVEGAPELFLNRYGARLSGYTFSQRVKRYTVKAGISGRRLCVHSLRHFFALSFLRNGGDLMALQKLLGHSSLEVVRNYVNMTDDDSLSAHRRASPLDRIGALPGLRQRVLVK